MKRLILAAGLNEMVKLLCITLSVTMLSALSGQADFGIVSRRGCDIAGSVEGPVRILAEDATLTIRENGRISGNLAVPKAKSSLDVEGTPLERGMNRNPVVAPRFTFSNQAGASAFQGAQKVEGGFGLPAVEPIVLPAGAVDVDLGVAAEGRSERINGEVLVPGTYRNLSVRSGKLKLGNLNGSLAKYNLRSLTIGTLASLELISPVCISIQTTADLGGQVGVKGSPYWLELRVFSGEVVIAPKTELHAFVNAPSSQVSIGEEALCVGAIVADRVTMEKGSKLLAVQPRSSTTGHDGTGPLFIHKALRAQSYLTEFQDTLPDHLQALLTYRNELPLLVISERFRPVHRQSQQQESLAFLLAAQALLDGTGFESAQIELHRLGSDASPTGDVLRVTLTNLQYLESLWAITRIQDPKSALRRVRGDSLLMNLFVERCCKVASSTWHAR